jgi:hypothetical protein
MCACLPQHPWLFIFSSRGHDRQSSDQNFSSRGYDQQSSEQNNWKLISLHNNGTLRMSDNLPERVQILCDAHIICISVLENRIICSQIFCDLLLKSAFEWIFNVMQLILVKIKWKYLIQKFHDTCLSYYFNRGSHFRNTCSNLFWWDQKTFPNILASPTIVKF